MFDLISGDHHRVPHRDTVPLFLSIAFHVLLIGAVAAVPLLYVTSELPEVPDMLAFVAAAPPPPPPPPPPAAARPKPVPKPVPVRARAVPVEPAKEIVAEASEVDFAGEEGIPGGVEGGVPGGIVGGIVGGLVGGLVPTEVLPPPPPPPAPPVARGPVRVGGAITAPALVSRVEPVYPPLALRAQVQGVVILEAVVDRQGGVEQVEILRSFPLLDAAAVAAVRQWR